MGSFEIHKEFDSMSTDCTNKMKELYPEKFVSTDQAFGQIRRGDRLFIGTACGEPNCLLCALVDYVDKNPLAFLDTEVLHAWTQGTAPYANENYKANFRANSLFLGNDDRDAVNKGFMDYTPVFLSQVPALFRRKLIGIDLALIQTSPPDEHGYVSLGISVDMTKEAVNNARLVIAQVNSFMPRTHGDSFIHIEEIDFIIPCDEPILEYSPKIIDEIAHKIGSYVALLVEDGDTIQIGYGSTPNAILSNLRSKRHLGVHTELLTDGIVELMKEGVIDNSRKTIDRGKTVAAFCMGSQRTYDFIDDNPSFEFRTIDYTNNPRIIAYHHCMTAINSALGIDLTGQVTIESVGKAFFNGIGGVVDFMRGAILAPRGKTILTLPSTTEDQSFSRIVPFIGEGAGITLNRGDIHYVVTEYGIAYLHGKSIRERAMELIAIAHPKFRSWLVEEAKKAHLIYRDQLFIPGKQGEYPEHLEVYRVTKTGLSILLRPVKITDEPLLKELGHRLSDQSIYNRFFSTRTDMPHEYLQRLVVIDYSKKMAILGVLRHEQSEEVIAVGRYFIDESSYSAEIFLVVRDDYQNQGLGRELLSYLTYLAKKQGLLWFTAEVLLENAPMLHLFRWLGKKEQFAMTEKIESGVVHFKMRFRSAHD
jgi:acyl-CoA hydrolase/GNAT superfamily N-acetyltransferase